MVATLVTNTMILTLLGVTSGIVAGLLIAPRLINMQGDTSGIGSGIAVSLSAAAIAAILAVAPGHRRGGGADPGPPHDQGLGLRPPAHPIPPAPIPAGTAGRLAPG